MSFARATGSFARVSGLSPYFTEALNATGLVIEDTGTQPVDLAVTAVTAPTTATAGQTITVSWQVTDESSQAVTGSWQDSVYISATAHDHLQLHPAGRGAGEHRSGRRKVVQRQLDRGRAGAGAGVLLRPRAGRQSLPTARSQPGQQHPGRHDRTARRRSAIPDARHGPYRFVHRRRPGSLLPGYRAGRRIARRVAAKLRLIRGGWRSTSARGPCRRRTTTRKRPRSPISRTRRLSCRRCSTSGTYYILAHSVSGAAATAGFTLTVTQDCRRDRVGHLALPGR